MNLTPQESKVRQMLMEPSRKSNIYGGLALFLSFAFFFSGFFSHDRAAFFAGGYVIAIYAFSKYLLVGMRYSEDVRTLIEKYEQKIQDLEKDEAEPGATDNDPHDSSH